MKRRLIKSALISLFIAAAVVALPLTIEIGDMMTYDYSAQEWFSPDYYINRRSEVNQNPCDSKMFTRMEAGEVEASRICQASFVEGNDTPVYSTWDYLSPSHSIWRFVWIFILAYIGAMVVVLGVLSLISKFLKKKG